MVLLFLSAVMVEGDESGWLTTFSGGFGWLLALIDSPGDPYSFRPHMPTFSTSNTSVLIREILSLCGKTSYSYLSASKATNTP